MVTAKQLREMLTECPDEAEIEVVGFNGILLGCKHANLVRYKEGGPPMVLLCPMGAHVKNEDYDWLGVTTIWSALELEEEEHA